MLLEIVLTLLLGTNAIPRQSGMLEPAVNPAQSGQLNPAAQKLFDSAYDLQKKGKVYDALRLYERAIQLAPASNGIWMEYTVCARKAGYLQRAVRAGWRTIELGPPSDGIWANLGNAFMVSRAWDASMKAFKEAAALSHDRHWSAQNFLNLGYEQLTSGNAALALKTFLYATAIDPPNALAHIDCGMAMAAGGKDYEGVKEIKKGLSLLDKKDTTLVEYAQNALNDIQRKGKIDVFVPNSQSFQKLPDRFLTQPAHGSALSLQIDDSLERQWQISPEGVLAMTTPESWRESRKKFEYTNVDYSFKQNFILYEPPYGDEFNLLWSQRQTKESLLDIESDTKNEGKTALKSSTEDKLELIPIISPSAKGYAFVLTDKKIAGKKHVDHDYPYMIRANLKSGDILNKITILSDSRDEAFLKNMLKVLQSIAYSDIGKK
jgi:tetratricopeptide (TPR) repeat protein